MGTRSLTVMQYEDGREIAVMYRQMDGYPSCHGQQLADFLKGHKICNGFSPNDTIENAFNGPECMAAAIVAHFKNGIGGRYLMPAGTRDAGEEYIYTVKPKGEKITLSMKAVYGRKRRWTGPPEDFNGEALEEAGT